MTPDPMNCLFHADRPVMKLTIVITGVKRVVDSYRVWRNLDGGFIVQMKCLKDIGGLGNSVGEVLEF